MNRLKIIEKCNKIHNFYYDYSLIKDAGIKDKIEIICPEHGIFEQRVDSHIRGKKCLELEGR